MTDKTVRLTNGQQWTARDFLGHYFQSTASATTPVTGPPVPVDVDRSWYMSEGPGRYYHPGMFPMMRQLIDDRNRAPGTYDLKEFVPTKNEKDPALTANLSNYTTDVRSNDYPLRAFVFGNESARISGRVVVNPDGSKRSSKFKFAPWIPILISKIKTGTYRLEPRERLQDESPTRRILVALTRFSIADRDPTMGPAVSTMISPTRS
jgi:hypothetical protein